MSQSVIPLQVKNALKVKYYGPKRKTTELLKQDLYDIYCTEMLLKKIEVVLKITIIFFSALNSKYTYSYIG